MPNHTTLYSLDEYVEERVGGLYGKWTPHRQLACAGEGDFYMISLDQVTGMVTEPCESVPPRRVRRVGIR